MSGTSAASDESRGFALIVVVWFLVLIAAIGTYMMVNARSETALAHNLMAGARAEALADAAVAVTVFNQTDPDPRKKFKLDGTPYPVTLPGGTATLRLIDETAKINPNLASDKLMSALFEVVGLDRARATRLGAATADWVSPGDQPSAGGAKKAEYQQAGKNYGPPNAPIESLDELQLVLGMTPEIFAAARPYLTIFTASAAPDDQKKAFDPVRRAMQLAGNDLSSGTAPAAPQAPQPAATSQSGDTPDDRPVPGATTPPAPGQPQVPGAASPDAGPPVVIEINATAHSADGGTFVRHAVVKLGSDSPKGYVVLDWRRGELPE